MQLSITILAAREKRRRLVSALVLTVAMAIAIATAEGHVQSAIFAHIARIFQ